MGTVVSEKRSAIDYAPGLDGIRGLCMIGVLLFHAPFSWMSGGFLGVSTFFTLSGYLITTLLLAEVAAAGRVDLAAFWERRMRRLGPPLWIGVLATVATAPWWVPEAALERLDLDALSALLFMSNWRFMSPEYAYSRLFTDPSAMQHCWSLAIEAQYYLLFPIAFAPLARRLSRRGLGTAIAAVLVGSVAISLWGGTTYRIYYGTDTRAAEILVGAVMAVLLRGRPSQAWSGGQRFAAVTGGAALVAMLGTWSLAAVDSPWLYDGGFALYAIASALLIHAAIVPGTPVARFLSWSPLTWIGRISYGAYVYHWPIFLWLSPARTGLDPVPLFALRTGLALAAAAWSYRVLESPVRARRRLGRRSSLAVATAVVAVLLGAMSVQRNPDEWRLVAAHWLRRSADGPVGVNGRPLSFSLFGDSTALELSGRVNFWFTVRGMPVVGGKAQIGCSLIEHGKVLTWLGWNQPREECRDWLSSWASDVAEHKPDVAIVLVGPWEVRDRILPGHSRVRALGDPSMDAEFRSTVSTAVRLLRNHGVKVVWLTFPRLQFEALRNGREYESEVHASDPARIRRLNEIIESVALDHPDDMRVVDFARYMEERPGGPLDPSVRSDGVHFTRAARPVIAAWLGGEIVRAARQMIPEAAGGSQAVR